MREDLKREKVEGDKRVYMLVGELLVFLWKMVEVDLAHENEELKLEKSKGDKLIVEADRRAKMLKRSTKRAPCVGSVSMVEGHSRSCPVGGSVCVL